MPPPQHYRVTWSGEFVGLGSAVIEQWSFGCAFATTEVAPTLENIKAAAATAREAWVMQMRNRIKPYARLTRTRVARLEGAPDGRLVTARFPSGQYVQGDDLTVSAGAGVGSANHPPQLAIAVTLLSDFPGPTGKGRLFLPAVADIDTLDADLRLPTQAQTNITNAVINLLVATAPQGGTTAPLLGRPVVASGGSARYGIDPGLRPITRVATGKVVDTMRSRRRDLVEERVASNLPW